MGEINKDVAKAYDLEGNWDEMIFTLNNPSGSAYNFSFFNPMNSYTANVATSAVTTTYPNDADIVSVATSANTTDNTLAYDSIHDRMYMGYKSGTTNYITWQDGTDTFGSAPLAIPFFFAQNIAALAFSPTSNRLFVLGSLGTLYVVNAATNAIVTFTVLPSAGAPNNGMVYNSVNDSVYIASAGLLIVEYSCATLATTNTVATPVGSNPFGLAFKAATNEIFVTYKGLNQIANLLCSSLTLTTLFSSVTSAPQSIIYNSTTDKVTYGSLTSTGVRTFDATTLVFDATVINDTAAALGIYSADNKLYLMSASSSTVKVINGTTLATVESISTTSYNNPVDIKFFPRENQMLFNTFNSTPASTLSYGTIAFNPNGTSFYITGNTDYNQTARDIFNSPAWVRRIYIYASNQTGFNDVYRHIIADANGQRLSLPLIPSLSVGINQFQPYFGLLDFPNKDMVLGINQWIDDVIVPAGQSITLLVIYKQIQKIKLLSDFPSGAKTICDEYNSCINSVRKWSDTDLEVNDWSKITPYKQNMFEGQKEEAVKPFDFGMLAGGETKQAAPVEPPPVVKSFDLLPPITIGAERASLQSEL